MRRHYGTRSSSSSEPTDEEWRAIVAFASSEVERIKPRNPDAYRATVIARKLDEISENRAQRSAMEAMFVGAASVKVATATIEESAPIDLGAGWEPDPNERRAIRERALLLAKMEAELGADASWK